MSWLMFHSRLVSGRHNTLAWVRLDLGLTNLDTILLCVYDCSILHFSCKCQHSHIIIPLITEVTPLISVIMFNLH